MGNLRIRTNLIYGILMTTLLVFSPVSLAKTLVEVQEQLSAYNVVRGNFEQVRELELFDSPLVSSGTFIVAKQQGLFWRQTVPFDVELVLTKEKLSQKFASQKPKVMTSSDNPMVFYFTQIFLDLFQGNAESLKGKFKLTFHSKDREWVMSLVPTISPLDSVFSSIEISGTDNINRIRLVEVRGDTTTIRFSGQTHLSSELSSDEKLAFQL